MGMGSPGNKPWVRWIGLLVFVAVLAVVFVKLGEWQLDRLEERRTNNAVVQQHQDAPIVDYRQVFGRPITDADQWQRVSIVGVFDAEHQFEVRYRNNDDRRGYEVVTPLRTPSGDLVLIDRGFIESKSQDTNVTLPQPPSGTVTIVGHVRRSEHGSPEAIDPVAGQVRLINAPAISRSLGEPVLDGYIGLLEISPAQTGDFRTVVPPRLDEGPHFSYAIQWFAFTVIAVVGLVVFVRSDIKELRARARARSAAGS